MALAVCRLSDYPARPMTPAPEQQRDPALWCGLVVAAFFGLALILILALTPWPFREALGKGWI